MFAMDLMARLSSISTSLELTAVELALLSICQPSFQCSSTRQDRFSAAFCRLGRVVHCMERLL